MLQNSNGHLSTTKGPPKFSTKKQKEKKTNLLAWSKGPLKLSYYINFYWANGDIIVLLKISTICTTIYIYIRPHPLIFLLPISYNTFSRSFQNFELTKLTVKTFIRSLFFFFFFLFLSLCNKVVLFYIPLSFRCYYNTCSSYICYCLFGLYFIWVRLIFLGK